MSASDKKKLRKEQNVAAMTEKQRKEQKEAKALKAYTISFVVVIVLVVAIVLGVALRNPVTGMIDRGTQAITVGNHEISATEFNYYYYDSINSFVSNFSQYGDYATLYMQMMAGLNPSASLSSQTYNKETGETWADYFITAAKNSAKWNYAMYDKAMAEGFTLSEDAQKSLDGLETSLKGYATYKGFSSVGGYLRAVYGAGANLSTYKDYCTITTIADAYASQYYDSLEFTDADYREYEKDKYNEYSSYDFAVYKITSSSYLTFLGLGTEEKDEDGKTTTTYTDDEKKQALEAAKKDAEALTADTVVDLETLNAAINALEINKPEEGKEDEAKPVEATEYKHTLYSNLTRFINEDAQKWLSNAERKAGDVTFVEITTGTDDEKTVTGYYVILFQGVNENKYPLANVQHILVKFEGGTKDSAGNTTYSDAEKAAAKDKAQTILDAFLNGEKKDSDAFGALAKEKSEDGGSKNSGGLISDISWDSNLVESFTEWALDENRKVGDTGLVESTYGWHIMFYKEDGELTYRDTMLNSALTNEKYTEWEESIVSLLTVTDVNLSKVNRDVVISG